LNLGTASRPCQARQHPRVPIPPRNRSPIRPFEQRDQGTCGQPGPIAKLGRCGPAQLTSVASRAPRNSFERRFSTRNAPNPPVLYTAFSGKVRQQRGHAQVGKLLLQLRDGRHLPAALDERRTRRAPESPACDSRVAFHPGRRATAPETSNACFLTRTPPGDPTRAPLRPPPRPRRAAPGARIPGLEDASG